MMASKYAEVEIKVTGESFERLLNLADKIDELREEQGWNPSIHFLFDAFSEFRSTLKIEVKRTDPRPIMGDGI